MSKPVRDEEKAQEQTPFSPTTVSDFVARGSAQDAQFGHKPHYRSLMAMWRKAPGDALRWLWSTGDEPDYFLGPVRWLFGRELVVYLRSIAMYSAFGDELDHRDWMQPNEIDLRGEPSEEGGFWFDYVSDTGDSQLVMYNISSLLLSDLYLDGDGRIGEGVRFEGGATRLPRGRFVFFGGDTAYHVADLPTLERRVCAPMAWAQREQQQRGDARAEQGKRRVFAIPGNHDYYDSLIGFNRLFRAPDNERVPLADYHRCQQASYVALRLPYDFLFLGLDSQRGRLDRRQRAFFRRVLAEHGRDRLIVATPEPVTVFDAVHRDLVEPFAALDLPRPFTSGTYPASDALHLDLAGDVHHYARYTNAHTPNYGQVVSGGGAFLHPTQTSWAADEPASEMGREPDSSWPPRAAQLYPSPAASSQAVAARLLCPWIILRGGGAFILGALSAVTAYLGIALGPGMHRVFDTMVRKRLFGDGERVAGWGTPVPDGTRVLQGLESVVEGTSPGGLERQALHPSEWCALALIAATLLYIGLASRKLFAAASARDESQRQAVLPARYSWICLLSVLTLLVLTWLQYMRPANSETVLAPFLSSFQLSAYFMPLPLSLLWVARYLATLPKQAKLRRVQGGDSVPRWVALVCGAGCASLGLWAYGSNSVAAFSLDLGAMFALAFSLLVPVGLGVSQGGERGWRYRIFYGALGLCFGVFQLSLPLSLALFGRIPTGLWTLGAAFLMQGLTLLLYRRWPNRYLLLAAFLCTGATCLGVVLSQAALAPVDMQSFTLALLAGGLFTCVWLGFYLLVSLAFGAHNNEAGGAARLDAYRHFVRLKVEPDRITGYVIGFDRPEVNAMPAAGEQRHLRARLVDRFELYCRKKPRS